MKDAIACYLLGIGSGLVLGWHFTIADASRDAAALPEPSTLAAQCYREGLAAGQLRAKIDEAVRQGVQPAPSALDLTAKPPTSGCDGKP